jgi:hypothetical protein
MMDLEEQIRAFRALRDEIAGLEKRKKALGAAILQQMQEKTMYVAGYVVRRYQRISIKLSLEDARRFDAVKTEEVVDKDRIKSLYELGHSIPGVSELQWVQVSEKKLNA